MSFSFIVNLEPALLIFLGWLLAIGLNYISYFNGIVLIVHVSFITNMLNLALLSGMRIKINNI